MREFEAQHIHKTFRPADSALVILRGAELRVARGEAGAILGVSGAGKATLLHILGGREKPSEGAVRWDGQDLYALEPPELARFRNGQLGFVFQFHHLLPEFSAHENVMMPALLAGWKRRRAAERADEMLEAVGLSARASHRPGKLSGGERQRVAMARALVMNPPVVLADEPTGNLDPHTAEAVEDLLLGLNRDSGTALIMVPHNEKLADRLRKRAYLVDGRLVS